MMMVTTTTTPPLTTTTPELWRYLNFISLKNSWAKKKLAGHSFVTCSYQFCIKATTHKSNVNPVVRFPKVEIQISHLSSDMHLIWINTYDHFVILHVIVLLSFDNMMQLCIRRMYEYLRDSAEIEDMSWVVSWDQWFLNEFNKVLFSRRV